jgi:hypothetical protein
MVMVGIPLGSLRRETFATSIDSWSIGDDWSTLEKRLDVLLSGVEELYSLMWKRLNGDQHVYEGRGRTVLQVSPRI